MLLDHPLGRVQPVRAESAVLASAISGSIQELRLPGRMVDMNVRPLLLAREEVEAISTRSEDSRTYDLETPAVGYFRSSQPLGKSRQRLGEPLEPLLRAPAGLCHIVPERFRR